MRILRQALGLSLVIGALLVSMSAQANPLVRISTTYGDFTVELFEDEAPLTVANFLDYVARGDYAATFVHRSEGNFVVQTGGYRFRACVNLIFDPADPCGPLPIRQGPTVLNEPGISNTRGTLAMAKLGGDPDSATNQWFVNLGDNSAALDEQNGGFTVFGRVLGEGMTVVDRIAATPTFNLGGYANTIPLRNFSAGGQFPSDANFIKINPLRVERFSLARHMFEFGSGRLLAQVYGGEELGAYSLHLRLVESANEIIFELDPRSMIELADAEADMASYDEAAGVLEFPYVEINEFGQVRTLFDLRFRLIDAGRMRFVLESYRES